MQRDLIRRNHVGRPIGLHVVVFDDAPGGPALDRVRSDATLDPLADLEAKGGSRGPGRFLACVREGGEGVRRG